MGEVIGFDAPVERNVGGTVRSTVLVAFSSVASRRVELTEQRQSDASFVQPCVKEMLIYGRCV